MSRDGNYSFTASEDNMKVQYVFLPIRKLLYLLYSDGSDSEIREWFSLAQRIDKQNTIFPRKIATFFFFGLIGFSFARKYAEEREEWEEVGNNALEQFHKWVENSDWNFKNKLNLLLAERCFLQDNQQNAFEQYDSAIRAARDHKFVHEEGLANAAAAKCCLHYGKKKEAMIYYAQAKDCYGRWGANALVSRIEEICRKL
jgi:tetratricopeptide (TPR) repeat protein